MSFHLIYFNSLKCEAHAHSLRHSYRHANSQPRTHTYMHAHHPQKICNLNWLTRFIVLFHQIFASRRSFSDHLIFSSTSPSFPYPPLSSPPRHVLSISLTPFISYNMFGISFWLLDNIRKIPSQSKEKFERTVSQYSSHIFDELISEIVTVKSSEPISDYWNQKLTEKSSDSKRDARHRIVTEEPKDTESRMNTTTFRR